MILEGVITGFTSDLVEARYTRNICRGNAVAAVNPRVLLATHTTWRGDQQACSLAGIVSRLTLLVDGAHGDGELIPGET